VEESLDFTPLLLVSVMAVLVPFVAWRLTGGLVPAVIGEVLVGIIFGEPLLGIITHDNEWLTFLGLFGFAYLMFLSGLEINLSLLGQSPGRRWYIPGIALRHPLISGMVLLILVVASTFLGLRLMTSAGLITTGQIPMLLFILIATAVGVIVPVLKDRPDLGRMGQSLLVGGFLLEFVAIVGVGVVSGLEREGISWKIFLILAVPAALVLMVWLSRVGSGRFPIIPRTMHELAQTSSQLKIRASLALLVVFVALSQVAGTEMVLGAFVAGLAVTVVSPRHGSSLRGKLDALGYGFFVPIFFIHAGATLDLGAVFHSTESLILVPALLLVAFGAKMVPSLLGLVPAWGIRPGLAGGSLLSANLSLVLAAGAIAADLGVIDDGLHGALLLMALITTVLAPLMFSTIAGRAPEQAIGQTLIVGGGDLARTLVERLMAGGRRVIVLDRDSDAAAKWDPLGVESVVGDPLDALTLISVRLLQTDVAVVVDFDHSEQVVEYSRSMRRIHPTLRVVTWTAETDPQLEHMDIEAHSLSDVTALALEEAVLRPGLHTARTDPESGLVEVEMLNQEFDGHTLSEIDFEGDVRVLVVMRDGESSVAFGDTSVFLHDRLTLAGEPSAVALMSGRFQQTRRHRWLIDVRTSRSFDLNI
jgi:Kef-type K+ transport system membrane component KefB/Trk K+ transport system NAD-binding subunit